MTPPNLRNPYAPQLTVVVLRDELFEEFGRRFQPFDNAVVVQSRWEDLPPHDCFGTAANSYGIMNAGIDAAVVARFGKDIQARVQQHILDEYHGEQPVGSAFLLDTGDPEIPYLCHAPTMRVPRGISGTDNVYRAAYACFVAVAGHNRTSQRPIESLVIPAFGAGFGGVPVSEVARQISVAWRLFDEVPFRPDWDRVVRREQMICMDGDKKVVHL